MPILSIKEFAESCSKESKDIHVYIGRGKVIKHSSGGVDTNNKINKIFIDAHKNDVPKQKVVKQVEIQPIVTIEKQKQQGLEYKEQIPEPEQPEQRAVTAAELNDLKAEKLEQEIISLRLKNQRLEGEIIELELVKQTMFEVINAYRTTNYLAAENVMKNNMKDLNCNNDQLTKAISDLTALFNSASNEAIENVKLQIERIL